MDEKKWDLKKTLVVSVIALAVILYIVGMLVLPDEMVIQIGADGQANNTASKPLGLLIPFGISVVFSLFYWRGEKKYLAGMAVGILCYVLTFAFNL